MKTNYIPYQESETRWSISLADVKTLPEEASSHAKARTPKPKAKAEKTNPVIRDAQRRTGETKMTNPLIANAEKRALKAQEVA